MTDKNDALLAALLETLRRYQDGRVFSNPHTRQVARAIEHEARTIAAQAPASQPEAAMRAEFAPLAEKMGGIVDKMERRIADLSQPEGREAVAWQVRMKFQDGRWSGWSQAFDEQNAIAQVGRYEHNGVAAEYRCLYTAPPVAAGDGVVEALQLFQKAKRSIAADAYDGVDDNARALLEQADVLANAALSRPAAAAMVPATHEIRRHLLRATDAICRMSAVMPDGPMREDLRMASGTVALALDALAASPTPPAVVDEAMVDLVAACEQAFMSDATEAVEGDDDDVSIPPTGITFGMIRRARAALAQQAGAP